MENKLSLRLVIMGLQHTFVMFGATVLVPLLTGLDIGVTLLAAGIGTLLFHFLTKMKVPVFLGSSFAFLPGIFAIASEQGLAYATGGIAIAGLLYIVVAVIFRFVSYDVLHKIFPPYVTGPMIILIGLMLSPVAINSANGNTSPAVVEMIGVNGAWLVALVTLVSGIIVKIVFAKIGWKFLSNLPVLLALIVGYVFSMIIGIVDYSSINNAQWFALPGFVAPKFSGFAISMMVPIAIVTIVEHFGDVLAIGNVVGQDFIKDPGISRTLLGDGLATTVSGLIGGPANTTYSENTGAVALTGVFNPAVMRIAAVFAIFLAFIQKFTAIIGTIPGPVIGGISILLFGMIAAVGIRNMVDAKVDLSRAKVLIIASTMLVLGMGGAAFSAGNFNLSGLGLAAVVGIILNLVIREKNQQ